MDIQPASSDACERYERTKLNKFFFLVISGNFADIVHEAKRRWTNSVQPQQKRQWLVFYEVLENIEPQGAKVSVHSLALSRYDWIQFKQEQNERIFVVILSVDAIHNVILCQSPFRTPRLRTVIFNRIELSLLVVYATSI